MKAFNIFFVLFFSSISIAYSQDKLPILTLESILNCKYNLEPGYGEIDLKNGNYYYQIPGEFESIEVWHHLHISCDLNSDSLIDAIIVLEQMNPGHSGHWHYIFPVINKDGIPTPQKPFVLGDRQNVQKIYKRNNYIFIKVFVHGIDDPMCCPSIKETWKLKFQGDSFIQIE